MKLLFVGEGPHDIGKPDFAVHPRLAGGVTFTLARKVCPRIAEDSIGLFWREILIVWKERKLPPLAARLVHAVLFAEQNGCAGTICVVDRDRDDDRLQQLEEGKARALQLIGTSHHVICGVARESIESWTLGDLNALASVLDLEVKALQEVYKVGDVESLYNRSGKPERRSKDILERVAALANQADTTELRERVADAADLSALERTCPMGFEPFARQLRAAFGT